MAPEPSDQKHAADQQVSELDRPMWSVISFERREAGGLVYAEAVRRMAELDSAGVSGLCLLRDKAAERVGASKA